MVAVADRLGGAMRLYADGGHSPMPPLPFVLEFLASGGRGTWLTESVLNFVFQTVLLLAAYRALRACAPRPVAACAALAAAPIVFSLPKLALHDSSAQCFAALASVAVVEALRAPSFARSAGRWACARRGCSHALCALSRSKARPAASCSPALSSPTWRRIDPARSASRRRPRRRPSGVDLPVRGPAGARLVAVHQRSGA